MYTNQQPPNWSSSRTETEAWAGRGQGNRAKQSRQVFVMDAKGWMKQKKKERLDGPFAQNVRSIGVCCSMKQILYGADKHH